MYEKDATGDRQSAVSSAAEPERTLSMPALPDTSGTVDTEKATADTQFDVAIPDSRQDFSARLLQLSQGSTAGQEFLDVVKELGHQNEDPNILAHLVLQTLYRGHEDCIPHVEPYFYDSKVIERLFYGDKGLFLRSLGRGGFGSAILVRRTDDARNEVWKIGHMPGAYDGITHRWHSITGDETDERWLERMSREAEAFSELGERGISPKLTERGTLTASDGYDHPYFATEYVPGMTLKQLIRSKHSGKTPPQLTADVGVLFGVQLSKAHDAGYVHRDISSGNTYVSDDGRALILDWGLTSRGRSGAITMMGAIMGTPEAMSPEVAAGKTVDAIHSTDVYSLATILHELQTGRPLIIGEDGKDIVMKQREGVRDLSLLEQCSPRRLTEILTAALDMNSAKRPHAEKLARMLYPMSSLYLRTGKMPFDEFLERFDELGRLGLPPHTSSTQAIPSRFAVMTDQQTKNHEDLAAESASAGTAMYEALVRENAGTVRRETRGKILKVGGGAAAALLLAGLASTLIPGKKEEIQNRPTVVDTQADPNAPHRESFSMIDVETLRDGRTTGATLFRGRPYEIVLKDKEIVTLRDASGTRALVFRLTGPQALQFLGYADPKDFPRNDELPDLPEKGMEGECVTFIDAASGESVTYFSPINTWVMVENEERGRVYSHRNDVKDSLGTSFESPGNGVTSDEVLQRVISSFPEELTHCTDPNSPGPGGEAPRSFAASIPSNLASQLKPQFPRSLPGETAANLE